jgi:prenylcysteine alpha-carboxyl methylesterase
MCSETYVDVLKTAGAKAKLQLYKGKTHTDVFVQVSYPEYQLYIL